jgi:transposase
VRDGLGRFDRWSKGGTWDRILRELQGHAHAVGELEWTVSVDSTIARAHQHAAGARRSSVGAAACATAARSNHKILWPEPDDHALGRSRGGWTTKTHAAVDARGRPLAIRLTAGQAGDNPQLLPVLDQISVPTGHRPRSRPDVLIADKAYSHPSTRRALRRRAIRTVIPERRDQTEQRTAKGSRGGRPPVFAADLYCQRNVVERCFNRLKQWRGIASRYDKTARNYRAGLTLAAIVLFRLA